MRFDLSDEEWSVLEPLMPKSRKSARPHDRRIINAIFYVLRTGIPWRDLPERYGPYTSAYNRFKAIFDSHQGLLKHFRYLWVLQHLWIRKQKLDHGLEPIGIRHRPEQRVFRIALVRHAAELNPR